jgi:GMP synthase (glutamine-hydrolysing)
MRIAVIDNGTDILFELLYVLRKCGYATHTVHAKDIRQQELSDYHLVLLSGGLWYDDPTQQQAHYGNELEFIAAAGTPILGICLGMQLIASAFGGELMPLKEPVHGRKTIHLTQEGQDLLGWEAEVDVIARHTIGVVKAPPQFKVLAVSGECAEIIKHQNLPIAGIQFHPEMSPRDLSIEMWRDIIRDLPRIPSRFAAQPA